MDIIKVRSILGWSAVVNFVLLFVFGIAVLIGKDMIYNIWSNFFTMSFETYDILMISFLGFWKILVIVFFVIPYIAIGVVNKKE